MAFEHDTAHASYCAVTSHAAFWHLTPINEHLCIETSESETFAFQGIQPGIGTLFALYVLDRTLYAKAHRPDWKPWKTNGA